MGNDDWDFDSVCHLYQSLENDEVRGTRGPHLIVRASEHELGKIQKAFLTGVYQCGFPLVLDLNASIAEGAGPSPVYRRGDDRVSAAKTFIDPTRHFPNLEILSESLVDRITFSNNRAAGILLANKRHILATHEVILSTGAILSPAILQRSGIGRSQLLHRHGITSVIDLPIGLYAHDHPCIPTVAKQRPGSYEKDDYSLRCHGRWSS
jgi:choline dehydrogenase